MKKQTKWKHLAGGVMLASTLFGVVGCGIETVVGAAVISTYAAVDRRTVATQAEDKTILFKGETQAAKIVGEDGHVNVTSYNRKVLLTGEVPTAQDRQRVEQVVAAVDNVRGIVNDLGVMPPSTLGQRSTDTLITGKVRASFVDAPDLLASVYKVVTERNVVYLLGRVTQREAQRATEIARGVDGVTKVVRVFEIISEDELRRIAPAPAPETTPSHSGS